MKRIIISVKAGKIIMMDKSIKMSSGCQKSKIVSNQILKN